MKKAVLLVLAISILLSGCNFKTRMLGGTQTVELPKGKKLIQATWKESNLWYLTRDMKPGEEAEIYEFIEDSNLGVAEGKVIFKEQK